MERDISARGKGTFAVFSLSSYFFYSPLPSPILMRSKFLEKKAFPRRVPLVPSPFRFFSVAFPDLLVLRGLSVRPSSLLSPHFERLGQGSLRWRKKGPLDPGE